MLSKLNNLFVGQRVRVSHSKKELNSMDGVCKAFHAVPESNDSFQIELEGGHRFRIVPEVVTLSSIDGELRAPAGGRRKVELIEA